MWIPSLILSDQNLDIVRPVVENFADGLHLNVQRTHRLRQFWIKELGLAMCSVI